MQHICTPYTVTRGDRRREVIIVGLRHSQVIRLACLHLPPRPVRPRLVFLSSAPARLHTSHGPCRVGPKLSDKLSDAPQTRDVLNHITCALNNTNTPTLIAFALFITAQLRLNPRKYSPLSWATHFLEFVLLLCLGGLPLAAPCDDCLIRDGVRHCVDLRISGK